ncbi:MAG: septal ring lytic transglycosylase RlpA family protein [Candidatus Binataceae bacterium]
MPCVVQVAKGWRGKRTACYLGAAIMMSLMSACSSRQLVTPRLAPHAPISRGPFYGTASWYGPGFDGHRTANGEIYNQEDLTAACQIFPFGTLLMVTNLANHKSVEVRVNDHGPYVKGRSLDLSHKAARILGMIGPGTARVRMEVLDAPYSSRFYGHEVYFVQVGSFARAANARHLRERLSAYYRNVSIDRVAAGHRRYYRVRLGAYRTHRAAEQRARSASRFGLPIVVVQE